METYEKFTGTPLYLLYLMGKNMLKPYGFQLISRKTNPLK